MLVVTRTTAQRGDGGLGKGFLLYHTTLRRVGIARRWGQEILQGMTSWPDGVRAMEFASDERKKPARPPVHVVIRQNTNNPLSYYVKTALGEPSDLFRSLRPPMMPRPVGGALSAGYDGPKSTGGSAGWPECGSLAPSFLLCHF